MTGKPRFLAIPPLVAVLATLSWGAQLARVEDFRAEGVADGIRLAWKPPVGKEIAGYRIYRVPSEELKAGKAPSVLVDVAPTAGEHIDRTVDPDVVYAYLIAALDGKGAEGARTVPVLGRVRDTVPPSPPRNFSATARENGVIRLSWDAPADRDLSVYRVYRSVKGIRSGVPLPPVKATGPTGRFEDRVDPKSPFPYIYRVTAVDVSGNESVEAGPVEVSVPDHRPPGVPVVTGLSVSDNGIRVEWAPPQDADLAGFRVYRKEKGTQGKTTLLSPAPIPVSRTFFLDNTARGGVVYAYTVTALDNVGNEGRPSAERSQKALAYLSAARPSGLSVAAAGGGYPALKWERLPAGDLMGYIVYRREGGDNTFRQVSSLLKETEFEDRGASTAGEMRYSVRALYRNGQVSEPSEPAVWNPAGDGIREQHRPAPASGEAAK